MLTWKMWSQHLSGRLYIIHFKDNLEKREISLPKRSRPSNRRTHSKLSDDQESPAILMAEFVVIGGGIAGVSCAQELARIHSRKILIISSTDALKEASNK